MPDKHKEGKKISELLKKQSDSFQNYRFQYFDRGFTDCFQIFQPEELKPLQEILYNHISPFLMDHSSDLDLEKKLAVPLKRTPSYDDWRGIMSAVNESPNFEELIKIHSESVKSIFEELFETKVQPFPVCRFRAQYPGVQRSQYDWHQDEGTYYNTTVKDLSFWLAGTLWVSVNGADESNSIELIPNSHKGPLEYHKEISELGYFSVQIPKSLTGIESYKVTAKPGEGLLFHPLTLHRTVVMKSELNYRYSLDIRYVPEFGWKREKIKVRLKFFLKRLATKFDL